MKKGKESGNAIGMDSSPKSGKVQDGDNHCNGALNSKVVECDSVLHQCNSADEKKTRLKLPVIAQGTSSTIAQRGKRVLVGAS